MSMSAAGRGGRHMKSVNVSLSGVPSMMVKPFFSVGLSARSIATSSDGVGSTPSNGSGGCDGTVGRGGGDRGLPCPKGPRHDDVDAPRDQATRGHETLRARKKTARHRRDTLRGDRRCGKLAVAVLARGDGRVFRGPVW